MQNGKIYIVEDSFLASLHLSKLLESEGYSITGISDTAEKALEEIPILQPDLVLLDIMLAGTLTGTEAATVIKDQYNIPFIYITALTDQKTIRNAKVTEPYGYLMKPFDNREVLTLVEMSIYKAGQDRKQLLKVQQTIKEKDLAEMNQKIAELRLEAIHSVMNPHFIFNALNSVQYFIASQNRVEALNYLSVFSKLMRSILNHSIHDRITLQDELEMLTNYVKLEQVRFHDVFEFEVHIQDGIQPENIEIPSLLIQPYLEHAILYGLTGNKEKGLLKLEIQEVGEQLQFIIEDNGAVNYASRKSFLQSPQADTRMLSEDRLRLITQSNHIKVEVTGLTHEIHARSGTRLQISIPLTFRKLNPPALN